MSCCNDDPSFLASINSSTVLDDIPPEVVRAALDSTPDSALELAANTIFLNAGQIDPGLYLILDGTIELFGKRRRRQGKNSRLRARRRYAGGRVAVQQAPAALFGAQPDAGHPAAPAAQAD